MKPPQIRLGVSSIALILANLIPIVGVIWWDWDIFGVVALYWLENVMIGVFNILKMLTCSPDPDHTDLEKWTNGKGFGKKVKWMRDEESGKTVKVRARGRMGASKELEIGDLVKWNHVSKVFFIPFFSVHYGIFCAVHGVFVFSLLGGAGQEGPVGGGFPNILEMAGAIFDGGYKWGVIALGASHLVSFLYNWFFKGEYRRTATPMLMISPYGRIVVLHIAIILGAFVTIALGSGAGILAVLILGKIILDLILHQREHRKAEA